MRRASSLIAFAIVVGGMPLAAAADTAFTLRDVDVFTGPGSEYPPVETLPPNTRVDVAGCLSDWSWCDVIFSDSRGWVYAGDLGYPYQNSRVAIIEYGPRLHIPVIAFSLPAYWDAHYRSRPWYRERDVWVNRVHAQVDRGGRPPQGRAERAASSTGAAPTLSAPTGAAGPSQQPSNGGQQPQYTEPRQPDETMQRSNTPPASRLQPSQISPQQSQVAPDSRARDGNERSPQPLSPARTTQPSQSGPSAQSRPEIRPPENRPPDNHPPEARQPDNRPAAGRPSADRPPEARPSESPGTREQGPPSDRGEREGKGAQPDRRGDNGPDRDRQ